jgi:hypothetical protein
MLLNWEASREITDPHDHTIAIPLITIDRYVERSDATTETP